MTVTTPYLRLRLTGIPRSLEDELSGFLFELGASGISEVLQFDQPNLVYDPLIRITDRFDIDAFFTEIPSTDTVADIKAHFPTVGVQATEELSRDWMAEWKKTFKSFHVVGPFWVVPSWEKVSPEIQSAIRIDPGMAFGTGTHETTRLASDLIYGLGSMKDQTVLDVGTGTGILAMIAERLGSSRVVGLDIDPEARRTARENIELNKSKVEIPEEQLSELSEEYHLLIANIIDGVLISLRDDLLKRVRGGGRLVLSGILLEREDEFSKKFLSHPSLSVLRRTTMNEWCAFVVQKK